MQMRPHLRRKIGSHRIQHRPIAAAETSGKSFRAFRRNAMTELLPALPAFFEPLLFGLLGTVATLAGSILRSGLSARPRRVGDCFCVLGLTLMTLGFICITSNMSFIAYARG